MVLQVYHEKVVESRAWVTSFQKCQGMFRFSVTNFPGRQAHKIQNTIYNKDSQLKTYATNGVELQSVHSPLLTLLLVIKGVISYHPVRKLLRKSKKHVSYILLYGWPNHIKSYSLWRTGRELSVVRENMLVVGIRGLGDTLRSYGLCSCYQIKMAPLALTILLLSLG